MEHRSRRVVTGHDESGNAKVLSDELVAYEPGGSETHSLVVWGTAAAPADNRDERDGRTVHQTITPISGGSIGYVSDWPPHGTFPMHRTHTIDYLVVLEGEIELELDGGDVIRLQRGDTLVQRGTNHIWRNPSDCWARTMVVMLEAKPLVYDGAELPRSLT